MQSYPIPVAAAVAALQLKSISRLLALLLLIHFLASGKSLQAQKITVVARNYTFHSMGTGTSTFDRAHYFMLDDDGDLRKTGYFGQHIRPFFSSDSNAIRYLNAYRNYQTFKLATAIATVGSFIGFAASNLNKEAVSTENLDKPEKGRGFLYATIGFFATNLATRLIGTNSMRKAVESYNANRTALQFKFNGIDFELQDPSRQKTVALVFTF